MRLEKKGGRSERSREGLLPVFSPTVGISSEAVSGRVSGT